jgi:hypothetical protein
MTLQRTDSFVPLTTLPASGEDREFHVTVVPKSAQTGPVQSLQTMESAPAPLDSGRVAAKNCEPRVSLQCDGDRITNIRVQCSCGQIVDLACVYEPASKPA